MMLVSGSLGRCSAGVGADDAAFALSSHQTQTFIWKSLFCGESYTPARSDPLHPHLVWISAVKSLETPWRYPSTTLLQFFATALCAAVARPVTLGGASSRDKITILLPNKKRRDTFHGAAVTPAHWLRGPSFFGLPSLPPFSSPPRCPPPSSPPPYCLGFAVYLLKHRGEARPV